MKPVEKLGFRPGAGLEKTPAGRTFRMRVMFFTWLVLIATGLVFYTVIGLAHN
jgi:hypothetical protein